MKEKYRMIIDDIDAKMLELLSERLCVIDDLSAEKRENGLPIEDLSREEKMLGNVQTDEGRALIKALTAISKAYQKGHFNIYLTGMPYSGKSTVLRELADVTDRECVDTDELIEKLAGMSIPDIFKKRGEDGFRKLESDVLRECARRGSLIVATGGGILTRDGNIPVIKNSGTVVLIDRPLDELRESYLADKSGIRPLIKSVDDLELMYFERFKRYRETADMIISDRADAAAKIIEFAKEKGLYV